MILQPYRPLRPLVVGPARGGFTMCIHVLHQIVRMLPDKRDLRQLVLDQTVRAAGPYVTYQIQTAFDEAGMADRLLLNRNFDRLTGGPKWLADGRDRMCVRKYVGAAGLGDFTIVLTFPLAAMDEDNIIHSHIQPEAWVRHPYYRDYVKIATVRNPVGIVNSACFSINPLTSEYLQRFLPERSDDDTLRQSLAEYKLTDLDFFRGLLAFQKAYWSEFSDVSEQYDHIMRWEDLIDRPVPTIQAIADACDVSLSERAASEIWGRMRDRNLTGYHKHNYRKGQGRVGGWKSWLTNEHLELFDEAGLYELAAPWGYEPEHLNETQYSPFQQRISKALKAGRVLDEVEDRDLFGFAFNKSNLMSEKFPFHGYDPLPHVHLERSDFRDRDLEIAVMHAVEAATERLNELFGAVLAGRYTTRNAAMTSIESVRRDFVGEFSGAMDSALDDALDRASEMAAVYQAPARVF